MTDIDKAKSHAARRSDAITWGVPILALMVFVGGVAGIGVARIISYWWLIDAVIGGVVFLVVAHLTGVVAGSVFERIVGDSE